MIWLAVLVVAGSVAFLAWQQWQFQRRLSAVGRLVNDEWHHLLEARQLLENLARQRLAERLDGVEDRVDELAADQHQLTLRDAELSAYVDAIRAARRGASVEQLQSSHRLGQAEAELIVAMHARQGRTD